MSEYIAELSALPPLDRYEAYRAIPDKDLRNRIAVGMPVELYSHMMPYALVENLNRNVLEEKARREAGHSGKPDKAA